MIRSLKHTDRPILWTHIATMNDWRERLERQRNKIDAVKLDLDLAACVCGNLSDIDRRFIEGMDYRIIRTDPDIRVGEVLTLREVWLAASHESRSVVGYCHLKGVTLTSPFQDTWAEYLEHYCLTRAGECITELAEYDVVGVELNSVPLVHFSGNFWWARSSHVRRLPDPANVNRTYLGSFNIGDPKPRFADEFWIGLNPTAKFRELFHLVEGQVFNARESEAFIGARAISREQSAKRTEKKPITILPPTAYLKRSEFEAPAWKIAGPNDVPDVTLITLAGDRPKAFELCEQWISRQTFRGSVQWIVVDDGKRPTTCTLGQERVARERQATDPTFTFVPNMKAALIHGVRSDKVLWIEDDDYYGPEYLDVMTKLLNLHDLVGEGLAKYYNVELRLWWRHTNTVHASLAQTGARAKLLPMLACLLDDPFVDFRVWRQFRGNKHLFFDNERGSGQLFVGMKGMPGRVGIGSGHTAEDTNYRFDANLEVLRVWVGPDCLTYEPLFVPPVSMVPKEDAAGRALVYEPCPSCKGGGRDLHATVCAKCGGTGKVGGGLTCPGCSGGGITSAGKACAKCGGVGKLARPPLPREFDPDRARQFSYRRLAVVSCGPSATGLTRADLSGFDFVIACRDRASVVDADLWACGDYQPVQSIRPLGSPIIVMPKPAYDKLAILDPALCSKCLAATIDLAGASESWRTFSGTLGLGIAILLRPSSIGLFGFDLGGTSDAAGKLDAQNRSEQRWKVEREITDSLVAVATERGIGLQRHGGGAVVTPPTAAASVASRVG